MEWTTKAGSVIVSILVYRICVLGHQLDVGKDFLDTAFQSLFIGWVIEY